MTKEERITYYRNKLISDKELSKADILTLIEDIELDLNEKEKTSSDLTEKDAQIKKLREENMALFLKIPSVKTEINNMAETKESLVDIYSKILKDEKVIK